MGAIQGGHECGKRFEFVTLSVGICEACRSGRRHAVGQNRVVRDVPLRGSNFGTLVGNRRVALRVFLDGTRRKKAAFTLRSRARQSTHTLCTLPAKSSRFISTGAGELGLSSRL